MTARVAYRNRTVDIVTPRYALDFTAKGIVDCLTARLGAKVIHARLDVDIMKAGGNPTYKSEAVKALRNIGYAIVSHKARHLSWYMLPATPSEYETHRQSVIRETYSRQVSICRELAGAVAAAPGDTALAATLGHAQMAAINLGMDVSIGMTITEVMADTAPL